jgi:hypothetical protein
MVRLRELKGLAMRQRLEDLSQQILTFPTRSVLRVDIHKYNSCVVCKVKNDKTARRPYERFRLARSRYELPARTLEHSRLPVIKD